MNTKKKVIGAGVVALSVGALATMSAFASSSDLNQNENSGKRVKGVMNSEMKGMKGKMMNHDMSETGAMNMLTPFLRADLTDTEKTSLQTILKTHSDSMKAVMEKYKDLLKPNMNRDSSDTGTVSTDEANFKTECKALHDKFVADVLPFVATDKQDAFKTTLDKMASMMDHGNMGAQVMGRGQERGRGMDMGMMRGQEMKTPVSPEIVKLIDTKLATLSTDSDKLAWLAAVESKLNVLNGKLTSTVSKNKVTMLLDYINLKKDEINKVNVTDDVLKTILQ